jgi:hypothetical protein
MRHARTDDPLLAKVVAVACRPVAAQLKSAAGCPRVTVNHRRWPYVRARSGHGPAVSALAIHHPGYGDGDGMNVSDTLNR